MSHREFLIPNASAEPPEFTIAGQRFRALPEPPGGALSDFFWIFGESAEVKAAGIVRFITACLPDRGIEERRKGGTVLLGGAEEFDEVIHGKDTIVPLRTLQDVALWLVEEYSGRPQTPSSGSGSGSGETPATPGDGSPSLADQQTASAS